MRGELVRGAAQAKAPLGARPSWLSVVQQAYVEGGDVPCWRQVDARVAGGDRKIARELRLARVLRYVPCDNDQHIKARVLAPLLLIAQDREVASVRRSSIPPDCRFHDGHDSARRLARTHERTLRSTEGPGEGRLSDR